MDRRGTHLKRTRDKPRFRVATGTSRTGLTSIVNNPSNPRLRISHARRGRIDRSIFYGCEAELTRDLDLLGIQPPVL
jgi:hypothetical protein